MRSDAARPRTGATTIRDVAAAAGVSVATASRVLSGNPSTSAASREAVTAAAAELGFRPNSQARALRSSRTASIGLLIPDIRNAYFADLAHSVERHARDRGLVTLISAADEQLETQDEVLRLLLSHNVDGLVVVPQGQQDSLRGPEALESVVRRGIPLVLVDRTVSDLEVSSVTADTSGLEAAVAHLLERGHRRIALIAGPSTSSTGRERRSVMETALAAAGHRLDAELVFEGDFRSASGARGVKYLTGLPEGRRPSAVVIADGPMTLGAIGALTGRGVRIPRDLSVVAYDDLEAFRLSTPALTVVAHDTEEMGAGAVQLLVEAMGGQPPRAVRLASRLHPRESVADLITEHP